MTKEELKALGLTDEQVNAISDDYGKNYVTKGQFNEKNEEAKNLKSEIENARKALRDETIGLVSLATEKVVGNVVTGDIDKKVIARAIEEAK